MMESARTRSWIWPTVLLCCYGFLKELRPSEPFLTPFLREYKNLTEEQVNNEVYPVWTYSYMVALIFVFLLSDLLRYKPVIVFEGLAYIGTWSLLIWAFGVEMMKLMQFCYALATSTEIAYYSYIFAAVSESHYQQVSSYTRSSLLTGRFAAAVLGQLLISFHVTTYAGLNYVSLSFVSIGFLLSLFLPSIRTSTYFHLCSEDPSTDRPNQSGRGVVDPQSAVSDKNTYQNLDESNADSASPEDSNTSGSSRAVSCLSSTKRYGLLLRTDFVKCFSNMQLLQWSLWWAFATCGNLQVGNYIQNLWDIIFTKSNTESVSQDVYNGAVEALSTLLGALSAFLIMFPRVNWDRYGELLLGLVSIFDAIVLVIMGLTTNIWLCYSFYVLFRASYQLVITIATFQIAKHLTVDRYALVFGWNTFVALVLEAILTFVVVDHRTLSLPADTQFLVYGGYFCLLGLAFCFKAAYQAGRQGCSSAFPFCFRGHRECFELSSATTDEERSEIPEQHREIDEIASGDNQQFVG